MIESGELTLDALKWKVRRDPPTDASGSTATGSVVKDEMGCNKFYGIKQDSQDGHYHDMAEKEI